MRLSRFSLSRPLPPTLPKQRKSILGEDSRNQRKVEEERIHESTRPARPRALSPEGGAALTQARVGPPLAQAGSFHQEHAGLVRHPGAEGQEQGPQDDAALEGREMHERKLPQASPHTPHTGLTPVSVPEAAPQAAQSVPWAQGLLVPCPASTERASPWCGRHTRCPGTSVLFVTLREQQGPPLSQRLRV